MEADVDGRVLLVEDDDDIRATYRALLEQAGWRVEEAARGDDGVALARRRPPSVALVDISIPGLDGWETARQLKQQRDGRLAVIVVTGYSLDEDREHAREVGADAYLVKPVDPHTLLAEIARLAARA